MIKARVNAAAAAQASYMTLITVSFLNVRVSNDEYAFAKVRPLNIFDEDNTSVGMTTQIRLRVLK